MNRIILLIALVPSLALAEKTYTTELSATHDCTKEPAASIHASGGTYTFTGACEKIGINGGNNTVTIEKVKKLGVNNKENQVEVGTADKIGVNGTANKVNVGAARSIGVNGTDNKVTYKTGPGGKRKPTVGKAGVGNSITQVK